MAKVGGEPQANPNVWGAHPIPAIASATRHCCTAFSALRACAFFLLAQKKGTKKKGARVSGGYAVPSPARRAAGGA